MPGIVKPVKEQDHLGTMQALAEYLKGNILPEKGALPRSESGRYTFDLNPVEVFDKKNNPGGAIYAEPGASLNAEIVGPVGAVPGGGVKKTLGNITAGPWRSRTLETIEKNPKMPESASPQTWLSKLKGAGLPKDELATVDNVLNVGVDPKSKIDRQQLSTLLKTGRSQGFSTPDLPELGVTKTTLGGREWEAAQSRLDNLNNRLPDIQLKIYNREQKLREILVKENPHLIGTEFENTIRGMKTVDPEFQGMLKERMDYLGEHARLSQDAVGKRPKWPQYNIEGLKDYKEEYFHAPLKEGGTYRNSDMEMHFADKPDNLLYLKHQGTLELPDGKKSTHMSTLQNDHAAEFDKQQQVKSIIKKAPEQAERLQDFVRREVPEPIMLNTWWKHGLKSSIKDAVKSGHDYFTWDPADTQMKRFAGAGEDVAQYMKNHYDNNIPGFLKKEYGVEAKKVDLGSKEKDMLRRSGVSRLQDPFTGEMVPSDQLTIVPHRIDDITYYDIGRRYPAGHEGHLQPRRQGFGIASYDNPEEAVARLREHIEHTNTPLEKKEVWQIPITEEIKKKVQEGQFWSKAARPGGKDAKGVA